MVWISSARCRIPFETAFVDAANEVVVESFLKDKIGFLQMSDIIEACMQKASFVKTPTIHDYVASDKETRALAYEMIN